MLEPNNNERPLIMSRSKEPVGLITKVCKCGKNTNQHICSMNCYHISKSYSSVSYRVIWFWGVHTNAISIDKFWGKNAFVTSIKWFLTLNGNHFIIQYVYFKSAVLSGSPIFADFKQPKFCVLQKKIEDLWISQAMKVYIRSKTSAGGEQGWLLPHGNDCSPLL